jgi:hypothetical protein
MPNKHQFALSEPRWIGLLEIKLDSMMKRPSARPPGLEAMADEYNARRHS